MYRYFLKLLSLPTLSKICLLVTNLASPALIKYSVCGYFSYILRYCKTSISQFLYSLYLYSGTYVKLREVIGRASGDFLDFKQFEPGMRYLIDNYIVADDAEKIAIFDDFTLLDFIIAQEDKLNKDGKEQESAAEAIENNIRKKVVQKIVINPAYYSKMSEVLEQLILDRKRGVITYKQLLERYLELAKKVSTPEENEHYPESIRKSGALRAFYDNCGEDEQLAIRLHKAVMTSKMDGFRNNPVKETRIKRELYKILKDEDMVERLYKIVVEQEEY